MQQPLTDAEMVALACRMADAQESYFRSRRPEDLSLAKRLESEFRHARDVRKRASLFPGVQACAPEGQPVVLPWMAENIIGLYQGHLDKGADRIEARKKVMADVRAACEMRGVQA